VAKTRKVLFVCLGNICRSPLAQGIFESKVDNIEFYADSAGTSGWHEGEPPHSGSIKVAERNSVSISKQRSRPVRLSDKDEFDYLIAMDRANKSSLLNEFGAREDQVFLMREFAVHKTKSRVGPICGNMISYGNLSWATNADSHSPI